MNTLTPQILARGFRYLEGPRWHGGKLWFSDMMAGKVMNVDEEGNRAVVAEIPELPSGLGFQPDGKLLIVSMGDRRLLRLEEDGLKLVADLKELVGGNTNDMLVDALGRAYIGNFGYDLFGGEELKPANLVLVTPEGEAREVADGFIFPNGMAITPDGKTFIISETFANRLTAFSIAPNGDLSERRIFAEFEQETPDGICMDAQGAVWMGSFVTSEFMRVKDGGEVTHRIPVPGKRGVACALGGADLRTLFMLTAEGSLEDIGEGKAEGIIETIQVEIPGVSTP